MIVSFVVTCALIWGVNASSDAQGKTLMAWEFNANRGEFEGWRPNGHIRDAEVKDGLLTATVVDWDPFLTLDVLSEPIKATATQVIEVRLNSPAEGTAEFFWTNTTEGPYGGFSPGKETPFKVRRGWHTYRIRPFWQAEGRIIKLRFDLPGIGGGEEPERTYQIDYIRIVELAPQGKPTVADWQFNGDVEGWQVEGDGRISVENGWLVAELGPGARLVAPPVEVNARKDLFLSFVMCVDRGFSGRLYWACDELNGLHHLDFPLISDGKPHVYNVPINVREWRGKVIYLAMEPVLGGNCRARIDWLRTSPQPMGPAEVEVRRFLIGDPLPRAGRPCEVVALVANRSGDPIENLHAELILPQGMKPTQGERFVKEITKLDYYEPQGIIWRVIGERPGKVRLGLNLSGDASAKIEVEERLLPRLNLPQADYVPEPKPARGPYEVGVYYFPGWATWDRWQPIMDFPERRPVLGWYREGSPEVADWHIKWAVEHGITFFCYDWYWDRGRRRLEHALHEGYFNARYRNLIKFCLLWANHAPTKHTPEDNVQVCRYWIENYFSRPEYFRINGRPLIIIFSPQAMFRDLGDEGVKEAIRMWKRMTEEAGVGEIYVAGCMAYNESMYRRMAEAGFDAITGYNWPAIKAEGRKSYPYADMVDGFYERWWVPTAKLKILPMITPTSPGWDSRPWHKGRALVLTGRTPEQFERHLRMARRFIDEYRQPRVILIEAWNEWGEGSYIEPHKEYGFGHLDAVRRVFCEGAGPHTDYGPQDVGLGPYDCRK